MSKRRQVDLSSPISVDLTTTNNDAAATAVVAKPWKAGMTEGVVPDGPNELAARKSKLMDQMLASYKIRSYHQVNQLIQLHPTLRSLADSLMAYIENIRRKALIVAVDSIKQPENVTKRNEFYRHIASTRLPSIDLVLSLRSQLLIHRSMSLEEAKDVAIKNQTRHADQKQLEDDVILAVAEQLVADAETLIDIAKGIGRVDDDGHDGSSFKKIELSESDKLEYGWMAVQMLDGGQRLVLVEISALLFKKSCDGCFKKQTHKRCGRCLTKFYCSTDCQKNGWEQHKSECKQECKMVIQELLTILAHDFQPIVITCPPPPPPARRTTKHK